MDSKNVIAAISLSAAVIILYSLFFAPSPQDLKQVQEEKNQTTQSAEAPSLEVEEKVFLSKRSKVWQQALNRVHVQKSILLYCFGKLR